MTGLPPFFHSDRKKLYEKISNEKLMFPKHFSPIMVDFLERLLEKNPEKRLGCGILGEEEIRKHKWFASIDWGLLVKKEIKPPFKPILKSEVDTSYFDPVKFNFFFNITNFILPQKSNLPKNWKKTMLILFSLMNHL